LAPDRRVPTRQNISSRDLSDPQPPVRGQA
jgi:hypothetical protein